LQFVESFVGGVVANELNDPGQHREYGLSPLNELNYLLSLDGKTQR